MPRPKKPTSKKSQAPIQFDKDNEYSLTEMQASFVWHYTEGACGMTEAARKAGYLINKAILDPTKIQIMRKEKADYVTNIDKECESEIVNILTKAYPKHEIIAEESTDKDISNKEWSN